jgi:hypothetical protein
VLVGIVVVAVVFGFVLLMSVLPKYINDRRDKTDQGD